MHIRLRYALHECSLSRKHQTTCNNINICCRLFSVPTSVLRQGPLPEFESLPVALVGRKSSQGLGLAVDPRDDSIYFSPLTETAIASWNPATNQQR